MKNNIFTILITTLLFFSSLYAEDLSKWLRPSEIPQPANNQLTPERIELGKLLFFDKRVSIDNSISCATCHHPQRGWTDLTPAAQAIGFEGRKGPRNSPVILNAAYQKNHFWDGRTKTLEEQALFPIEADVEMNMPLDVLIEKFRAIKGYAELFERAYPSEGITQDTFAKALASFERTIVSDDSPFDTYARGETNAISQDAKEGFEIFQNKAQCTNCHDGWNFSDGSFQNIGLSAGELSKTEQGRFTLKNRSIWYGVFKTPTLRDATKSHPYFHDGSVASLEEAVTLCSSGGRHKEDVKNHSSAMIDSKLSKEETAKVMAFISSLTSPDMNITIPIKFPQ